MKSDAGLGGVLSSPGVILAHTYLSNRSLFEISVPMLFAASPMRQLPSDVREGLPAGMCAADVRGAILSTQCTSLAMVLLRGMALGRGLR